MKRAFDILASLAGIIAISPLLLIVPLIIRLDSAGPAFFIQQRVGKGFRPFNLIKFRTMVQDKGGGSLITTSSDRRISRVGRILRKYKIDELPQLFNVLLGEMSFVGPRPEVEKYVDLFREDYKHILTVRPGITDYAAIEFRNEEETLAKFDDPEEGYINDVLPRKIELYKKYISGMGIRTDIGLILKTLRLLIK